MSIQEEKLLAIADAIREKDGSTGEIAADDFPDRIRAISPGVKSFNGRTGDVVPATGDYTAAQVGALSLSGGTIIGEVHLSGSSRIQYDSNGPFIYPGSSSYMPTLMSGGSIAYFSNRNVKGARLQGVADPINDADAANKAYVDAKASGIPYGVIVMWSGAANAIPTGWALCDGTNNTPDLRNRFIVGAGSTYAVGATGGSNTVTLTMNQMPSHAHIYTFAADEAGGMTLPGLAGSMQTYERTTSYEGGSQPHENRPPYYALCFIMKI